VPLELLEVRVRDLRDLARANVLHGDVGAVVPAIALPPVRREIPVERDERRVLLDHPRSAEVHA
jgi:hypothetical protein